MQHLNYAINLLIASCRSLGCAASGLTRGSERSRDTGGRPARHEVALLGVVSVLLVVPRSDLQRRRLALKPFRLRKLAQKWAKMWAHKPECWPICQRTDPTLLYDKGEPKTWKVISSANMAFSKLSLREFWRSSRVVLGTSLGISLNSHTSL